MLYMVGSQVDSQLEGGALLLQLTSGRGLLGVAEAPVAGRGPSQSQLGLLEPKETRFSSSSSRGGGQAQRPRCCGELPDGLLGSLGLLGQQVQRLLVVVVVPRLFLLLPLPRSLQLLLQSEQLLLLSLGCQLIGYCHAVDFRFHERPQKHMAPGVLLSEEDAEIFGHRGELFFLVVIVALASDATFRSTPRSASLIARRKTNRTQMKKCTKGQVQ
ncbi:hypothetical protein EYF80_037383 [Liparis tanakae]|uniref:Uncharacterized protein n=1 Tax=Liparis tanakae TaxID=230148 RepID=A0A4Z2GHP7_9TELE|nr:hypothetical protein EYF80_037383 [Liparis tanakae]